MFEQSVRIFVSNEFVLAKQVFIEAPKQIVHAVCMLAPNPRLWRSARIGFDRNGTSDFSDISNSSTEKRRNLCISILLKTRMAK